MANDICRNAVPAPKYLTERRSAVFLHHYTPDHDLKQSCIVVIAVVIVHVKFVVVVVFFIVQV